MSVSMYKLVSERSIVTIESISEFLMRFDSEGSKHWVIVLMPSVSYMSKLLLVLAISI